MEKGYRKYVAVMILCFLFGGYSFILYLMEVYSFIWQTESVISIGREGNSLSIPVFSNNLRVGNLSEINNSLPPERRFFIDDPSSLLLSPISLSFLIVSIISILAGFAIWSLVRDKEIKATRKKIIDVFLLPDEKKVLNEIERYGGSLTQSELVKSIGFSRVKVHRIIRNLEKKNLIIKQQYGMTNKIALKR